MCMLCENCGEPLNESQYSKNREYKSCPRCSVLNGKEHVYFPYPSEFGTTVKRESARHPDGPQSYCTSHRSNPNIVIQNNGIVCSKIEQ